MQIVNDVVVHDLGTHVLHLVSLGQQGNVTQCHTSVCVSKSQSVCINYSKTLMIIIINMYAMYNLPSSDSIPVVKETIPNYVKFAITTNKLITN